MFIKLNGSDMTDDEFSKIELPYIDVCNRYVEDFLIPDYVAYYIAIGYYRNSLFESSFRQHFNSAADMFVHDIKDTERIMNKTKELLQAKYCLKITDEKPVIKVVQL